MKMINFKRYKNKNHTVFLLTVLILLSIGFIGYMYYSRSAAGIIKPLKNFWFKPPTFLFSIYGEGDGLLNDPVAVDAAYDGSIFVADVGGRDIKVYDSEGRYKFKFNKVGNQGRLFAPVGLAVVGQDVYVADSAQNQIYAFDLQGNYIDNVIPAETRQKLFGFTPVGIDVTDSNIYFTDILFHRVVVTDLAGKLVKTIGSPGNDDGQLAYPNDVAVSAEGRIFVSDSNNFRVQATDDDQKLHIFRDQSSENNRSAVNGLVRGIAIDPKGYIWLANTLNHKVNVINQDGEPVYSMGNSETPGDELLYPEGINISNNHIYVADRGNHRIQVYQR